MEAEAKGTQIRPADDLINYSHRLLIEQLERYGNTPTPAHKMALRNIVSLYTKMAYGYTTGRFAVPLGTGMGKTQSIIAWITAMFHLGDCEGISLGICASQVEALCDIKRALIQNGVPENSIGLWHSYPYDPDRAEKCLRSGRQDLEKGCASLPSTQDHQSKQILLVTHNRLKGHGSSTTYNTYNGKKRSFIIWDESLFISESTAMELWKLDSATAGLSKIPGYQVKPLIQFLSGWLKIFASEEHAQQEEMSVPATLYGQPLTNEEIDAFKEVVPSGLWGDEVRTFLDISQYPLRLFRGQQSSMITFKQVIPPDLTNIVVLDASHNIRKLCSINTDVRRLWKENRKLTSYRGVTIHQLFCHGARNSMEKYTAELGRTDSGVLKEAVLVVKNTPRTEAILIFTFKQHHGKRDHIKTLRKSLLKNGIDPDEMIAVEEDGKVVLKRRINFLTFGNECSLNRFSYCTTVILAGLLHLSPATLAGKIAGEKGDITADISKDELEEVRVGELCHIIFQALSRGSCRIIKNGEAGRMKAYLIHASTNIRPPIDEAMPDVRWLEWTPVHPISRKPNKPRKPRKLGRPEAIADQVILYLQDLPPSIKNVSAKQIKRDLRLTHEPPSTIRRALITVDIKSEWGRQGGWLVRRAGWDF